MSNPIDPTLQNKFQDEFGELALVAACAGYLKANAETLAAFKVTKNELFTADLTITLMRLSVAFMAAISQITFNILPDKLRNDIASKAANMLIEHLLDDGLVVGFE